MYVPKGSPNNYYRLLHEKRVAELLLCALRFDLFTNFKEWETADEVAVKVGLNNRNLKLVLNALVSTGFLEKDGEKFRNTPESNEFLSAESEVDIRESLLFREGMMSLSNLCERLQTGPDEMIQRRNNGIEAFDFKEAARISVPEMYTGRVQKFIQAVRGEYCSESPRKILDLGGGSGILLVELLKTFSKSSGVIFESPEVTSIPNQLIIKENLEDRAIVMEGDFMSDSIGGEYDLIIAAGILDFTKGRLTDLVNRLYNALTPDGRLYVVTHQVSKDYTAPAQTIMGWLSSHLDGLDILLTEEEIEGVLKKQGFLKKDENIAGGTLQGIVGTFYGKE